MSVWQPIETAPEDGTGILLYMPAAKRNRVVSVVWENGRWVHSWNDPNYRSANSPIHDATYWQPLPEPPADGE